MIDIIGDIVDFLIRSVLVKILMYFIFLSFIIALIIEYGYFKVTGEFSFNIFFNSSILGELANYYKKEIAIVGIFITLFYITIYLYLQHKIAKRKNCAIQEVELAEIAKIWLEEESYKEIIRQEVINELPKEEEKKAPLIIPQFNKKESKELFRFIEKNQDSFSELGIRVISDILKMLENNPVSSVASKFKQDPNYKDYKKMIVAGKTSYDILSEVDLYTHTINVVNKAIEYLEQNNKDEKELYLERVIIASLGHDIGKIEKSLSKDLTPDIFKKAPHNVISAMIFREKYPELNTEIIEAIEQHHGNMKNKNNYTLKVLLEADKRAREKEINEWLMKMKNEKSCQVPSSEFQEISDNEDINIYNSNSKDINTDDNNENDINVNDSNNNDININNSNNEEDSEDEVFEISMDEIFEENNPFDTGEDYKGAKEKLIEKIKDNLCLVKKDEAGLGLDLEELVVAFNKKVYISFALLDSVVKDRGLFINEAIKSKEAYIKAIKIEFENKEYKAKTLVFRLKDLGFDEDIHCDEVNIISE